MAKKTVVEYSCDRCMKVWHGEDEAPMTSVQVSIRSSGGPLDAVIYETLCDRCSRVVADAVDTIKPVARRGPKGSG